MFLADKRSDASQQKRYQDIVQRRKLVDLAKAQAQEVAVLRAEVERLRMRTFPALVQVEHWNIQQKLPILKYLHFAAQEESVYYLWFNCILFDAHFLSSKMNSKQ